MKKSIKKITGLGITIIMLFSIMWLSGCNEPGLNGKFLVGKFQVFGLPPIVRASILTRIM